LCAKPTGPGILEFSQPAGDYEPICLGGSIVTTREAALEKVVRRAASQALSPNGETERISVLITLAGTWHCWFSAGERPRTPEEKVHFLIQAKKIGAALTTVSDVEVEWGGTTIACLQVARPVLFPIGEWLGPARVRVAGIFFKSGWLTPESR
jgi:hypothetical protein